MNKRYVFTASGLIFVLIILVVSVRHIRGTASLTQASENLKVKGPKDAPIHIVIYSDFQCPACKAAKAPLEDLRNQFVDSVNVEFRHYPLQRPHKWALAAATFAQCAAEQNKFWELHDRLFENQEIWSSSLDPLSLFAGMVQELGLDAQQFESCIRNPETLTQIQKEYSLGSKQGVQSTPTIFINGQMLIGAVQLKEKGPSIIIEELKKNHKSVPSL